MLSCCSKIFSADGGRLRVSIIEKSESRGAHLVLKCGAVVGTTTKTGPTPRTTFSSGLGGGTLEEGKKRSK